MAKIEELVRQISDAKLRDEIAGEIKELKKQKRFGLVFEEHLPEMLRLPKVKIRLGNVVAHRDAPGNDNKKSRAKQCIRTLRGKYKHLGLMKGLVEARKEERQPDSKTRPATSARSLKMLDKSAASLKKGLPSAAIDLARFYRRP